MVRPWVLQKLRQAGNNWRQSGLDSSLGGMKLVAMTLPLRPLLRLAPKGSINCNILPRLQLSGIKELPSFSRIIGVQ